jgi:hypothetical protein
MEPKKTIKKHYIIDHESELMELLSHISDSVQGIIRGRENMMGSANWVVCSSEVSDMINSMYEALNEDLIYLNEEDIRLRPRRPAENISITFTADTWTQDET